MGFHFGGAICDSVGGGTSTAHPALLQVTLYDSIETYSNFHLLDYCTVAAKDEWKEGRKVEACILRYCSSQGHTHTHTIHFLFL